MKNTLCIVLVILVFGTSLNRGQKIKTNDRRAIGIFPYPRTGRHLAMASFARVDGNAGMVNYPRVGRSGSMISGDGNSPKFFSDSNIDGYRDFQPEMSQDFDFSAIHRAIDYEDSRKRLEALRNGMWMASLSQAKENQRMHRCNQQIDGPWAVLLATRDMTDQQPVHNFVPRSAREVDHDSSATSDNVS